MREIGSMAIHIWKILAKTSYVELMWAVFGRKNGWPEDRPPVSIVLSRKWWFCTPSIGQKNAFLLAGLNLSAKDWIVVIKYHLTVQAKNLLFSFAHFCIGINLITDITRIYYSIARTMIQNSKKHIKDRIYFLSFFSFFSFLCFLIFSSSVGACAVTATASCSRFDAFFGDAMVATALPGTMTPLASTCDVLPSGTERTLRKSTCSTGTYAGRI